MTRSPIAGPRSNVRANEDSDAEESREPTDTRVLRYRDVCRRTGLSRVTLWRLERRGAFPARRQLSTNAVGWLEHEINDWIASRAAVGRRTR